MNARSIPIDVISVSDNLKAAGQLEAVGGQQYLLELADNTFAFTSWQHHAEIVSRDAIRRELLMSAAQIRRLPTIPPPIRRNLFPSRKRHCSALPSKR